MNVIQQTNHNIMQGNRNVKIVESFKTIYIYDILILYLYMYIYDILKAMVSLAYIPNNYILFCTAERYNIILSFELTASRQQVYSTMRF